MDYPRQVLGAVPGHRKGKEINTMLLMQSRPCLLWWPDSGQQAPPRDSHLNKAQSDLSEGVLSHQHGTRLMAVAQ